jgi:hypothetical protein
LALALTEYHKTWQSIHHLRTRHIQGIGLLKLDGTRQDKAWIRRHWGLFSFFSWGFYAKFGFLAGTNFIAAVFEFWRMMAFKDEWGVCR